MRCVLRVSINVYENTHLLIMRFRPCSKERFPTRANFLLKTDRHKYWEGNKFVVLPLPLTLTPPPDPSLPFPFPLFTFYIYFLILLSFIHLKLLTIVHLLAISLIALQSHGPNITYLERSSHEICERFLLC